jgi:hypothetical protein
LSFVANAQQKDRILPKANAEYAENKFVEAEANYRISVQNFQIKATAPFNLGNTILQNNLQTMHMLNPEKNSKHSRKKHRAFHNLGNVL